MALDWQPGTPVRATGLGVLLRTMLAADVDDALVAQRRDPDVSGNLAIGRDAANLTQERLLRWLGTFDNGRNFWFGIWAASAGQRLGFCTARIDNFGVATPTLVITERALWSHGAAAAATLVLRNFLFDVVKVHKLAARVYVDNKVVIDALERYGWVREGTLREAEPDGKGGRRDVVLYGMLRAEHEHGPRPKPFTMPMR
jgi:RimJ/RimL family protein N-acetyltransferase